MNANRLKLVYEGLPKTIKKLLSPLFIRVILNNKVYKKTLKELKEFDELNDAQKRAVQFEKLKETLIEAYNNVPYYRKRFSEAGFNPEEMTDISEMEKIPLLTKDDAIEAGAEILSRKKIDCYESVTGGSSGRALKVVLDKDSIYKERAFTNHFLGKYGYDLRNTRTLAFWGHNKDDDYYFSPLKNEIVISPFKLFDEKSFPVDGRFLHWSGIFLY